jgi:glycosyltransferase involved in cell wall biosynthesis
MNLFVIVPAYNEEERIGRVISGLFEHGVKNVVVVDDGSTDQTAEKAVAAGAVVLRHEVNRGQGAALQTGNEYALNHNTDLVVHFDADDQFNPADIAGAVKALLAARADVLLGSRFLDGRSRIPWTKKYIILPVSRIINKALTGLRLSDVHNGFRVLTRRALEKVCISQDRMAHNSEIIQQIKKQGLICIEYPVEVRYFEYGQGLGGGFKIIWEIFQGKLTK